MGKIYYSQIDSRWKNHPYTAPGYPNATTGSSGCGPTCAAMVVSSCKEIIRPDTMCDISKQQGYRVSGGTSDGLFSYVANRWGIEMKRLHSSFEAHQACKEGYFVIICCGSGLWTTGGHYILAVGATDTDIEIYDPYLYAGKFNRNGRQGKVRLEGTSAWVEINTFKASSNARTFFAFKVNGGAQPQPTPTSISKTMYVKTNGANLNVRDNPNGNVVGSLPTGTQVNVIAEQEGWSKIGEGKWVSSAYLTSEAPVVTKIMYVNTNSANLNVRDNPNGNQIGTLAKGTQVVVVSEQNGWSRITSPKSGWVATQYLSSTKPSGGTTPKPAGRNTVGQTKRFRAQTTIYSNSNLTGTKYTYKANTSVKIQQNVSSTVDKIKVVQTGRVGYVNISSYK